MSWDNSKVISPASVRVAKHRAIKEGKWPTQPETFARVVKHIAEHASPRKKDALEKTGIRTN